MDAPLDIILEMIRVIITNTLGTLASLFSLFGSLTGSLAFISGMGAIGFVVAALVFGVVLYFIGKFFLNSWKLVAGLFVLGIIILLVLGASLG